MKTKDNGRVRPNIEVQHITPEMAKEMLERNTGNRKLNQSIVQRYAHAMKQGAWKFNGDTIRIDESSAILDGQHRLSASVLSGVSFDAIVISGIPRETFDTIDTGKPRTSADALFSSGLLTNSSLLASIATLAVRVETNSVKANRYVEPHLVREWVNEHPDVADAAEYVKSVPFLSPRPAVGLAYLVAKHADPSKASEFFEALKTGENLTKGNPVYAIREFLLKNKGSRAFGAYDALGMILKAWQAQLLGKPVHVLRKSADVNYAYSL